MSSSPITCHVLNTLSGSPAADLHAVLTLLSPILDIEGVTPSPPSFRALTDQDGRVKVWGPTKDHALLQDVMNKVDDGTKTQWSIKFDIGPWYETMNVECFWPEIEVKFYVKKGERHYHVPVLVGPWTYTTYRGS